MNKNIRIAIDGPAAAGKSTVAKRIAQKLSIVYVDTGAMYRAVTLKALQAGIDINDESSVIKLLEDTTIELKYDQGSQLVMLDGANVTSKIRSNEVSNAVSIIAQYTSVRKRMVAMQKELANNKSVVMDGRDIGTQVLPDAEVKIFLIASVDERAIRRHKENTEAGIPTNLEQLKQEIRERDERDMNRKVSPLIKAEDAVSVDTTSLTIEEVADTILSHVKQYSTKNESS